MTLANNNTQLDALHVGETNVAVREDASFTHDVVSALSISEHEKVAYFLKLEARSLKSVTMTPNHRLPVGGSCCSKLKRAADVKVGDVIWTLGVGGAARASTATNISSVAARGSHSPVLVGGTFPVVDGVVTSFDSVMVVRTARALLWIAEPLLRVVY
jgi:hypothetical protein